MYASCPVLVADDETRGLFFDGPGRWEAARGHYLFVCSVAGPGVGMPGEPVVIIGNPEHDRLSRALFRRSSKGTHFLTSLPPMIWVISQHTRHRCWGGGRYSHRWRTVSLIDVNVY